jgi:hypothetical protein
MRIDTDKLLLDILKELGKDSTLRKVIDKALEKQDYQYNDESGCIQDIHTNPLHADFDDSTVFKIGDTIRNKNSGITAKVTIYLDRAYGLSNGCRVPAMYKDNWEKID